MKFTFSANSAETHGGAVMNQAVLTFTNSTLSENTAKSQGGALFNASTLTLINTTLFNNDSGLGGNGIFNSNEQYLRLSNAIISGADADGD